MISDVGRFVARMQGVKSGSLPDQERRLPVAADAADHTASVFKSGDQFQSVHS
jgi:hypothetical protein